ncbi:MAG TPA: tripartite tricarboxylate transporter substrate binding protein [Xanthobacteraceae bacterium]|nr:tripartite tricarboxylate transporter substrate binding protein [Xanthobacteraceae bacterium]
MQTLKAILLAATCVLAAPATGAAQADKYPSKPITVLVPYVPGGATDYAARLVAEKAKAALGQNIIIENKAGAGGVIALEALAAAKPDGYTLMIGNVSTNAITPILFAKRLTVDYEKAVVPVARLLVTPSVFVVNASFASRSFKEFIDYAQQNPGKVRYGTTGIGSFPHFDMEKLARKFELDLIHIPYKGGAGEMIKGLISGDVQAGSTNAVLGVSLRDSGKIIPLATNMPERLKELPDVPTFTEHGLPGHGTQNWSGLFAPAGTPPEVIKTLYEAFTNAAKDPELLQMAAKSGTFGFAAGSHDEVQTWLKAELAKWRETVAQIKLDLN